MTEKDLQEKAPNEIAKDSRNDDLSGLIPLSTEDQFQQTLESTIPLDDFSAEGLRNRMEGSKASTSNTAAGETTRAVKPSVEEESIASQVPHILSEESGKDRYYLDSPLGTGASGVVFRAHDTNLDRDIAVKFMHAKDINDVNRMRRFISEGRIAAKLDHPGVTPVYDMKVNNEGQPYLSMRRVKGETLDAAILKLRDGYPPKTLATVHDQVDVIIKVCDTIAFAHSQSVVHCDIKPANIMLGAWGEVTVLDWGTASTSDDHSTEKRGLVGTPLYMSPEQAMGQKPDARSDVYCIGATLYYLLTFQHPVWAATPERFWQLKRKGVIDPPPKDVEERLPAALLAIARKAMAAKPDDRYQTVNALVEDLRRYQGGLSVGAYPDTLGDAVRRWAKRRRKELLVAAAALSLITPAGVWYADYQHKLRSDWQLQETIDFSSVTPQQLEAKWDYYERQRKKHAKYKPTPFSQDSLWRLEDGKLRGIPTGKAIGNISWAKSFSGSFRVDWVIVPDGDPFNLNAFIGSRTRQKGYLFHIGGWGYGEALVLTKDTGKTNGFLEHYTMQIPLKKGEPNHLRMEREKGVVRLYLEGELLIDYDDPDVTLLPEDNTFGFEVHTGIRSPRTIREVSIYTKPLPELTSPIEIPHALLSMGHHEEARQLYQVLYDKNPYGNMAAEALFRLARCHEKLSEEFNNAGDVEEEKSHHEQTVKLYQKFLMDWPDHDHVPFVHFYLAMHELKQGDIEETDRIYATLAASYSGHDVLNTALRSYGLEMMRIYGLKNREKAAEYDDVADRCLTVLRKTGHWIREFGLSYQIDPTEFTCFKILSENGHQDKLLSFLDSVDFQRHPGRTQAVMENMGEWELLLDMAEYDNNYWSKQWFGPKGLFYLGRHEEILQDEDAAPYWKAHALIALGRPEEARAIAKSDQDLEARIFSLSGRAEDVINSDGGAPPQAIMALELFDAILRTETEGKLWLMAKIGVGESSDLVDLVETNPQRMKKSGYWRLPVFDQALTEHIKGHEEESGRLLTIAQTYKPNFRLFSRTDWPTLIFPHFLLQPTLAMLDGDGEAFDRACEKVRTDYPHHYESRIATLATMLLGEYGEDPEVWLETLNDPNRIAFGPDALHILAKGIRAERVGRPDLALTHYRIYMQCLAVKLDGDLVSRHFARWRIETFTR